MVVVGPAEAAEDEELAACPRGCSSEGGRGAAVR